MSVEHVFVYGTLRDGASNHFRMGDARKVGSGTIPGELRVIRDNPGFIYPALVAGEGEVRGEVYGVGEDLLEGLDRFEGIDPDVESEDEYMRVKISVKLEGGEEMEAWVWAWAGDAGEAETIAGGDWLEYWRRCDLEMKRKMIPPGILMEAYAKGIFPMAEDGEILWFSPERRGVIPLDAGFHIPRGLRKALRKESFEVRFNTAFREVMEACGERRETWIDEVILESYVELHRLGHAWSVECRDEEGLQGGLYGVRMGRAFFGESMFSKKTDASKIALVALVDRLREENAELLDTQWMTPHLRQFGGREVARGVYMKLLERALGEDR